MHRGPLSPPSSNSVCRRRDCRPWVNSTSTPPAPPPFSQPTFRYEYLEKNLETKETSENGGDRSSKRERRRRSRERHSRSHRRRRSHSQSRSPRKRRSRRKEERRRKHSPSPKYSSLTPCSILPSKNVDYHCYPTKESQSMDSNTTVYWI